MSIEFIVEKFLQSYSKPFTRSEFSAMMKGLRLVSSDKEANALLDSFDCIYKISDDYYSLPNESKNKTFKIGQKVTIKIDSVAKLEGKINAFVIEK